MDHSEKDQCSKHTETDFYNQIISTFVEILPRGTPSLFTQNTMEEGLLQMFNYITAQK